MVFSLKELPQVGSHVFLTIYIANISPKKNDKRFQKFRNLFRELNITRNLGEDLENWSYPKLDETNRVANIIKQKINS